MSHDDTTRTRIPDLAALTLTTHLSEFLRPFSADVVTEVSSLAKRSSVIVTGDELRHFRLEPQANLARLAASLEAELQPVAPERIIWCQTGDVGNGLDSDELAAILGRSLSITAVWQWSGPAEKRVLAIGVPRRELIAVTYTAPATASADQLRAFIAGCHDSRSAQPVVFVPSRVLAGVGIGSDVATALARFTANGGGIALLVSAADTDAALFDPAACLQPFERLGVRVRMAKFERGLAIAPEALDRFTRVTGLEFDSSVPAASRSALECVRSGAYSGAAPYRPQPFTCGCRGFTPTWRCGSNSHPSK